MTIIEKYFNSGNEPMVKVLAEDGSCICYTAERYAEVQATLVSDSSTLASELSNPSTPQAGE